MTSDITISGTLPLLVELCGMDPHNNVLHWLTDAWEGGNS